MNKRLITKQELQPFMIDYIVQTKVVNQDFMHSERGNKIAYHGIVTQHKVLQDSENLYHIYAHYKVREKMVIITLKFIIINIRKQCC